MVKKALVVFIAFYLLSCTRQAQTEIEVPAVPLAEETNAFFTEPLPLEDYLTIIAVGDNLYHNVMVRQGEQGDYEAAYREIQSLVQNADLAFINQETPLGGIEFGFTGYPIFNSPHALGRALSNVGFNVISHANNHIMDQGESGLTATLDFWKTIPEVTVLGIHSSQEERNTPVIIEQNNFRIGFLAYTYGTNGLPVPAERSYLVSITDREVMEREINTLRPLCDILIVSMHWGTEYAHSQNRSQEELAIFLAELEVDIVFGHHPHVLQPVVYIQRPDGRFMLCFYSLGNFISAQASPPAMLGAMAYVRIRKASAAGEGGRSSFEFITDGVIPLVTHFERNWTNFAVYPLYAYSEENLRRHWMNRDRMIMSMDYFRELSEQVLGARKITENPFR